MSKLGRGDYGYDTATSPVAAQTCLPLPSLLLPPLGQKACKFCLGHQHLKWLMGTSSRAGAPCFSHCTMPLTKEPPGPHIEMETAADIAAVTGTLAPSPLPMLSIAEHKPSVQRGL